MVMLLCPSNPSLFGLITQTYCVSTDRLLDFTYNLVLAKENVKTDNNKENSYRDLV